MLNYRRCSKYFINWSQTAVNYKLQTLSLAVKFRIVIYTLDAINYIFLELHEKVTRLCVISRTSCCREHARERINGRCRTKKSCTSIREMWKLRKFQASVHFQWNIHWKWMLRAKNIQLLFISLLIWRPI